MSHLVSCVGMKPICSMHGAVWMRRVEQAAIWRPACPTDFIAWTVTLNPLVLEPLSKSSLGRG